MGGKGKAHTVSLAPPKAQRGQNENKKKKSSLRFLPYAISKHPFGDLNVAKQELPVISLYFMSMNVSINNL